MSPEAGLGPFHPLFRPNPGFCPPDFARAHPAPTPPTRAATYLASPSRPEGRPEPRAGFWTPVPISWARHDRPARWLRVGGALLMAAGVVAVAYVIYTVTAADSGVGVAQERLAADFEAALTTVTVPAGFAEDDPTMATVTTTPGQDLAGPQQTTTTLPALIPEEPPATGQALGHLLIPAADVDWLIVEGVSPQDLAQGPGHMPGTALPGQPGNAVISGHRTTHGAPFYNLDRLQPGDPITIQTLIGTHTYHVVQVLTVLPGDVWVTNQVPGAWLTLTTCNPRYSARQRLIIFAQLTDGPNHQAIQTTLTGNETPPQPPDT